MSRGIHWSRQQNTVIQKVLKRARHGTRVIFVPGNHDEVLREYVGTSFGDIECGDWVDSCTAIVEHHDGRMELIQWLAEPVADVAMPNPCRSTAFHFRLRPPDKRVRFAKALRHLEEGMASNPLQMSAKRLSRAAAESVESGEHVRDRVRDLTLRAFHAKQLDYEGMKEVIEAMTVGISHGAQARSIHMKQAVAEALSGLDQALMQSAEASRRALEELTGRGRELSDRELKLAVEQMKKLESDFIAMVNKVAESAAETVAPEFRSFVVHAQRVGTETGSVVAQTMLEFSNTIAAQMLDAQAAGIEAAVELNKRFVQVASRFLQSLSQSLRDGGLPERDNDS